MSMPASPWIRFLELSGRPLDQPYGPGQLLWLTTGDVIDEYTSWPVEYLPVTCERCGTRTTPFISPIQPLMDRGRLGWFCDVHLVSEPELGERVRKHAALTQEAVRRLYPRFNPYAAPGEEWV